MQGVYCKNPIENCLEVYRDSHYNYRSPPRERSSCRSPTKNEHRSLTSLILPLAQWTLPSESDRPPTSPPTAETVGGHGDPAATRERRRAPITGRRRWATPRWRSSTRSCSGWRPRAAPPRPSAGAACGWRRRSGSGGGRRSCGRTSRRAIAPLKMTARRTATVRIRRGRRWWEWGGWISIWTRIRSQRAVTVPRGARRWKLDLGCLLNGRPAGWAVIGLCFFFFLFLGKLIFIFFFKDLCVYIAPWSCLLEFNNYFYLISKFWTYVYCLRSVVVIMCAYWSVSINFYKFWQNLRKFESFFENYKSNLLQSGYKEII